MSQDDYYDDSSKSQFRSTVAEDETPAPQQRRPTSGYAAKEAALEETKGAMEDDDPFPDRSRTIAERESEYHARRHDRMFSPPRADPFAEQTPDVSQRTYRDTLMEAQLQREEAAILRNIERKRKEEAEAKAATQTAAGAATEEAPSRKRPRWDAVTDDFDESDKTLAKRARAREEFDDVESTPGPTSSTTSAWDATPSQAGVAKKTSRWDATPAATPSVGGGASRWDQTPRGPGAGAGLSEADGATGKKRSRWDETPRVGGAMMGDATPGLGGATPAGAAGMGMMTPSVTQMANMTPDQINAMRVQQELDFRNRPLTDADLDELLPGEDDGYVILDPPASYKPIETPSRRLSATPTPSVVSGYQIPAAMTPSAFDVPPSPSDLPISKPDDLAHFAPLLKEVDESRLSPEEQKERMIMKLLLKIKNGTPPQRKTALRQITEKARWLGAGPLFNQILPLLMSPTLEDQERHLLVKVIDRVLFKLDELVRPFVHKILVVIEPLLIDEDYYARVEGREIISNLAKAAGVATMIAVMRPDIDNVDEYVRNTTARAFAVVASALGIHRLLPFLKAVCETKRSWQARHTGIKIIQQIAILVGCAVLPHLTSMVEIIKGGLEDEQSKVRCITALALAALAESAAPYGIESFGPVLKPLWKGIRQHRGKTLAAFLKAIGYIISLMDDEYAAFYTKEVMPTVMREFSSPDEEMKKIVLKVVKQCVGNSGVGPDYIRQEILPNFFKAFWDRRMALDKRNYRQVVETTEELAKRVGGAEIIGRIVEKLKDESEPFRKMVTEAIELIMGGLGASDVDSRLAEQLIDGLIYAFQEQTTDDTKTMLNGFGVVINALGQRAKPFLPQIGGLVQWRLNNKAARVRQQAADLIARIAVVMKNCGEERLLCHLGVVLYEYLGEEYPEVLGSILGALKAVVNSVGMERMTPPIKDLLPRLTPILRNRHEKVQENCIDLVGRIADRGAEFVGAKEWMRICFELLDLLKAHKKSIRRATVNTFGYIAKAIGPQDVLATLLNNLKVQERQNRVCTTVAIAIVAETCAPFTILPALMNEYRVPELNVQNGVLKALSFLFEYIGEMGKDYVYAIVPLLEDALMDRDLVHRQTACSVVKHMSLGVAGLGREDAMQHLLNFVWPNIFETTPHLIGACTEAIEGMRVALGPTKILQYLMQGLFHAARKKVRTVYWKLYNTLYIGSQDALVPSYPRVADDKENSYRRWELECFL